MKWWDLVLVVLGALTVVVALQTLWVITLQPMP
jgi:hypothetical protein